MVNTFHNDCNINLHSPKVQLTGQIKIRLADFNLSILCHLLTRMSAVKSPADVFAPQKLEVQKLARTPIFEPHHLQKLFRNTQKTHFRHGWRVDKTMTSFHKNNIFVKTRKVMGNTDVAHYQGRQSIYNIFIINYCKLTFEFFKNIVFEKRRQFLNFSVFGHCFI